METTPLDKMNPTPGSPQQREQVIEFLTESNAIEGVGSEGLDTSVLAWDYLFALDRLTMARILNTHQILMQRLNPKIAGRLRDCNVTVGGQICPAPELVYGLLSEWIRNHSKAMKVEDIIQAHIEFEKIHPFEDGNGRVGRIIYNWQRVKSGLNIHVIHQGVEQQAYYQWFKI